MLYIFNYLSAHNNSTPSQQTIRWVQHTLRHIHSLPHIHLLPPIPYLFLPCSVSGGTGNIEGTNLMCDNFFHDCTFSTRTASAGCTHSKDLVLQCSKLYKIMHDHDILSICVCVCAHVCAGVWVCGVCAWGVRVCACMFCSNQGSKVVCSMPTIAVLSKSIYNYVPCTQHYSSCVCILYRCTIFHTMSLLSPFTAGDQPYVCYEAPTGLVAGVVVAILFFCVILPICACIGCIGACFKFGWLCFHHHHHDPEHHGHLCEKA